MVMMSGSAIVTPANSREENGDWLSRIESGLTLSAADWEQLANEKKSVPWLEQSLIGPMTTTTSPNAGPQLVRARGMVQDIFDTEYFATNSTSHAIVEPLYGHESPQLAERTPLLITPIPFTTPWFRNVWMDGRETRPKRFRLFHEDETEQVATDKNQDGSRDSYEAQVGSSHNIWPAQEMQSDPNDTAFLAHFYYDQYHAARLGPPKLMLNQIVEVVGVLDQSSINDDDDAMENARDEWGNLRLPPSHVLPRLHVIWYQGLDLDSLLATEQAPLEPLQPHGASLAKAMKVSETVGTSIWIALLSMAERQPIHEATHWAPVITPKDTTLGCASLNVILPSADACSNMAARLCKVLAQVLPQVQCHSLCSDSLKTLASPTKRDGRIAPTPLQLPKGSTLILNAGSLCLEQLSPSQVERLGIFQQLVAGHKMVYTFDGGMTIPFEADVRIIVLSTMASSKILPCSLQVKCVVDDVAVDEMDSDLDVVSLNSVRDALTAARGGSSNSSIPLHKNISLPASVLEQAQTDFVDRRNAARQDHLTMPNDADFHRWLTLTRLQARCRRANAASIADWKQAVELDDAMMATLQ